MAIRLTTLITAALLATAAGAVAATSAWVVVKRGPTARAGELAYVGTVVRNPGVVAVRAVVPARRTVTLSVVMSCRKGIGAGVARKRLAVSAPGTKTLPLPVSDADNCAISASGTNPAGTLRLELLRGG
jgi:hypothetical protein